MTAELGRMKALAGLLNDNDLYDDDLFFSGSVKQKQQVIVEKLSKNTPIKDNGGVTSSSSSLMSSQHQQAHHYHQSQIMIESHNNNAANDSENEVQFGESADQSTFVSASVRERAAAMSGFLTKKKDGPTSGQARAMEWRGVGSIITGSAGGGGDGDRRADNRMILCSPKKIAPTFVSKFDRFGENDVPNGGTPTNNKTGGGGGASKKKKSKPSFLFQFEDNSQEEATAGADAAANAGLTSPRAPLTPRTPSRAPLTPRTPSRSSTNNNNNSLLSPRTPRTVPSPRSNKMAMMRSPRADGMSSHTTTNAASSSSSSVVAALNCSTAAEAGSITDEIDDWLGGMSLSDSEEGDDDHDEDLSHTNDNDGDTEFFLNDLDQVLLEANGFLEGVVASSDASSDIEEEEEEEEEEERMHFGFNEEEDEEEENIGMSDDLESELESARQLAQDFTRFLVRDDSSGEVVENVKEKVVDCGWADVEEEEEEVEDEYMSKYVSSEESPIEEEDDDDDYVEENEGDWEGWNSNNNDVFFANFDEEDVAEEGAFSQTAAENVVIAPPSQVEPVIMSKSETKSRKPNLRIQIKGAPKFALNKEEDDDDKGLFYYASQPSPLARDDEQLLDTQIIMPSPVAVESSDTSKTDTSPQKFGLKKKIVHRTCPESDEESMEESSSAEEKVSPFHTHFDMISVSLTKSDETEKKAAAKTPPKLTIYIKGAPQFTPSRQFEEDAFYVSQMSPLVGDDKGLLSSNFNFEASPSVFDDQKRESTLTSSTKKHFKNFVSKTLPAPKYQAAAKGNAKSSDQSSAMMKTFSDEPGLSDCFDNDFFFAAPASPVRQAKDVMKEGGSTKKKILGLLSGKKKKQQSKGLYLLDD